MDASWESSIKIVMGQCDRIDAVDAFDVSRGLALARQRIREIAQACGRRVDGIRLIAVSKTRPAAAVTQAVAAGQYAFGENTLQDAITKIPLFRNQNVEWHFIGHLQTNKAKVVPGNFQWVHSVDSVSLAAKLARAMELSGMKLSILLQVNVSEDPAKFGVPAEGVDELMEGVLALKSPALCLRGLMTIGKNTADESVRRRAFARLRELRDRCAARYGLSDFTELSMGMSGDYREAILEGATMIRLGTTIFGTRA